MALGGTGAVSFVRGVATLAGLGVLLAALSSVGLVATTTIHACKSELKGTVRVVGEAESCARGEVKLTWNEPGPGGPPGPPGAAQDLSPLESRVAALEVRLGVATSTPTAAPTATATPTAVPSVREVLVGQGGDRFTPASLNVKVGETVRWVLVAGLHTTTSGSTTADGRWDSGTLQPGVPFEVTFTEAGTFAYFCFFHELPNGQGMRGTIVAAP